MGLVWIRACLESFRRCVTLLAMIDTHAHIYLPELVRDTYRSEISDAGIETVLLPAIDEASWSNILACIKAYASEPVILRPMFGLHPCSVSPGTIDSLSRLEAQLRQHDAVAVGEIGLDYYWSTEQVDLQQEAFSFQLALASRCKLPVSIHTRDQKGADTVFRDILGLIDASTGAFEKDRGVFHCFGGPEWLIPEVRSRGFVFGIGGTVTFKNGGVDQLVGKLDPKEVVIETDAPYLAPAPHRGKENTPAWLPHIVARLATLWDMTTEDVIRVTSATARRVFRL